MLIDFYLENLTKNKTMLLPVTPENYEVATEEQVETVKLASIGDINIPTFNTPKSISIEGIFSTNENRYLNKNLIPELIKNTIDYVNLINTWKEEHDIIRVLIVPRGTTESRLDAKFYIKSLSINGEYEVIGDIGYVIEFVGYRETEVKSIKTTNTRPTPESKKEPAEPKTRTYTVKKGDSLWNISRKYYGNGNQYSKILNANKGKIKNANLIYAGQTFIIPY